LVFGMRISGIVLRVGLRQANFLFARDLEAIGKVLLKNPYTIGDRTFTIRAGA
jgi:hypothetical protein